MITALIHSFTFLMLDLQKVFPAQIQIFYCGQSSHFILLLSGSGGTLRRTLVDCAYRAPACVFLCRPEGSVPQLVLRLLLERRLSELVDFLNFLICSKYIPLAMMRASHRLQLPVLSVFGPRDLDS